MKQSVPTDDLERHWAVGWAYLMPYFDKPNHSIIEWLSEKIPVYPCVPENQNHESADEHDRRQQPA